MDIRQIIIRLLLAILFGGIIGLERETANRPAGFRTHILVCMGSTIVMLVSLNLVTQFVGKADPGRIPAQVISGIGFLGAGTIITEGVTVRGLTTAASLWTTAAIGLAIGSGFYSGALLGTVLTFIILITFAEMEKYITSHRRVDYITIIIDDVPGQIGKVGSKLGDMEVNIRDIKMQNMRNSKLKLTITLQRLPGKKIGEIMEALEEVKGVHGIEFN